MDSWRQEGCINKHLTIFVLEITGLKIIWHVDGSQIASIVLGAHTMDQPVPAAHLFEQIWNRNLLILGF